MRILYVTPGVGVCGGVRVIWAHCVELAKRGHEVAYGVPSGPREMPWLLGRVPVVINREVEDEPWDVVVATGYPVFPLVHHSFPGAEAKWGFVQMKESLFLPEHEPNVADVAFSLPGFRMITISGWLKEYLEEDCGHQDVAVIPNGVDTGIFYPDPIPELVERERPIALIVGHQLNRAKNISDAAEAIRMAGDFELWHVSPHHPHPHEHVGQDKLFVMPSQDELRRIYSTADVLVMSSRFEGRSCIPAEAMACNCPVVAMDHKGTEDLRGARARIAEAGDVGQLAQFIRLTLDNTEETRLQTLRAYNHVLGALRWDMVGKRLEQLYSSPAPEWLFEEEREMEEVEVGPERVEVIEEFIDRYTDERHLPGAILEVDEERAEELVGAGVVKRAEDEKSR